MSDTPIDDAPEDRAGSLDMPERGDRPSPDQETLDFPGPEDQERRREDLPRPDDEPVTDDDKEAIEDTPGVPLT
jgi:hypothetical protein